MGDRYSAFAVTEGKPLSSDLGFLAHTVIVDNITPSWLDMRQNVGRFIPPFTYGATFPLGAGIQVAQAAWATPPALQAPTVAGGQAQLTFTSAALPPSNGQQVVVPTQATLCTIASSSGLVNQTAPKVGATSFTITGGTSSGTVVFNVPPGTSSLTILCTGTALAGLLVQGVQSGVQYVPQGTALQNLLGTVSPLSFTFTSAADQQISFSFGTGSGGTVSISATSAPQAVNVENNSGLPVFVQAPGVPIQYATSQTLTTQEFATPVVTVPPAFGNGAAISTVGYGASVASLGSLTLVAAPSTARLYILHWSICMQNPNATNPANAILEDTAGNVYGQAAWPAATGQTAPYFHDYRPGQALVGAATGVKIVNNSSDARTYNGTLTYLVSNF